MTDFRFLHAADLHLGSTVAVPEKAPPETAALFGGAIPAALDALVETAIARRAAFVIVSGDMLDRDADGRAETSALAAAAGRLSTAGIGLFAVAGNHDAAHPRAAPREAHLFPVGPPSSVLLEDPPVAIHGHSVGQPQGQPTRMPPFPAPIPGRLNVALAHSSLDRPGDGAPCAPAALDDLLAQGHDYWALGHVHARTVRHREPPVVWPGNLQGRGMHETGAKGATLVHVADGRIAGLEALALDRVRFARVPVDLSGAGGGRGAAVLLGAALDRAAGEAGRRPLAARLEVTGTGPLMRPVLAAMAQTLAPRIAPHLVIEDVRMVSDRAA
jgi:DNA repair exonuclease SbcCD nuclease subunit